MRLPDELGTIKTLQLFHAPQDAGFQIHDVAGISEIARQLGKRTFHLPGALAEIATFKGDVLGTARGGPQRFTAIDIEEPRIAPGILAEHLPVLLDSLFGLVVLRCRWPKRH